MPSRLVAILAALLSLALAAPAAAQEARPGSAARVSVFAERDAMAHGVAGDRQRVFITEVGVQPPGPGRVVALDRRTGHEIGELPAPPGGFGMPFTLRVAGQGRLVVLDNAGFPPQGQPKVHEYRYRTRGRFRATHERTIDFAGLPLLFAEDLEVLPGRRYVVSESIVGALWLVGRDGVVRPGLVPSTQAPLAKLGPCALAAGQTRVGDLPFAGAGGFAPGAGSLAIRGDDLYVSSTCEGGIQRLDVDTLLDTSRPAEERAAEIETVAPRRHALETLKGIAVNRWDPRDPWIYAGDPFRLQLVRVHSRTGRRQVLSGDARRFDFAVATTFLPPARRGRRAPLITVSDQEYRWASLNGALTGDAFRPPFVIARVVPARR